MRFEFQEAVVAVGGCRIPLLVRVLGKPMLLRMLRV